MRADKIAVVGCGVVGSSWALVFTRAGYDVTMWDASPAAAEAACSFIEKAFSDEPADPSRKRGTVTVSATLDDALAQAFYVQESVSERVEIKRELYARMDAIAAPGITLASSTSGLPASAFTQGLSGAARCLVVHPINPPHLIPLVEIVPSPSTDPAVVESSAALMRRVGQAPIQLNREVNGFVVNRLQSALLGEAFRLVQDSVCSAQDVDKAISEGLGLRWFFMGPFETIDLNAARGIAEYCHNLGPMYHGLAKEQADPRVWDEDLVALIERERRTLTPEDQLPQRRQWRDRVLKAAVEAKRTILRG